MCAAAPHQGSAETALPIWKPTAASTKSIAAGLACAQHIGVITTAAKVEDCSDLKELQEPTSLCACCAVTMVLWSEAPSCCLQVSTEGEV